MATDTTTTAKVSKVKGDKARRLTIVFDGKFDALYQQIEKLAIADDRDMDTYILRHLSQTMAANS